jgi:hypothetical protein
MSGKWNGRKLYKGAGPGTHWWSTDARLTGFSVGAVSVPSPGAILTHISNYSFPSPYVSMSTSFAVAMQYAMSGPAGAASSTLPGYVYEIDTTQAHCNLVDPVEEISKTWLCHEHDGAPDLILAVADPVTHSSVLSTPPRRLGTGGSLFPPNISQNLYVLVYAIRDGEVLACSVPKNCVVNRHNVP